MFFFFRLSNVRLETIIFCSLSFFFLNLLTSHNSIILLITWMQKVYLSHVYVIYGENVLTFKYHKRIYVNTVQIFFIIICVFLINLFRFKISKIARLWYVRNLKSLYKSIYLVPSSNSKYKSWNKNKQISK